MFGFLIKKMVSIYKVVLSYISFNVVFSLSSIFMYTVYLGFSLIFLFNLF